MNEQNRQGALSIYDKGATPFTACIYDQRFSYCLYVPSNYDEALGTRQPLMVSVHGSHRVAESYRDHFCDFAEQTGCIILAPLFPVGVGDTKDSSGYKFLCLDEIRFDLILLAMVEEVREKYKVHPADFLLYGYSGGGQFAHRFFYCHPKRLRAVSIGAPGVVTLLDEAKPWWLGIGDIAGKMGIEPDYVAMRQVKVHMLIGGNDTENWEITMSPEHRFYLPGLNETGSNRIERILALKSSFEQAGIAVTLDIVPGVGHAGFQMIDPVKKFFLAEAL